MPIDDINALRKWNKIDKEHQKLIIENVFCSNCKVTTIVNYSITSDKYGIILKGKCKKCGKDVARVIEDI